MNRIIAALAVILTALTAAPAHADSYWPSLWVTAEQQVPGQLSVQLNAPAGSWGIRQAARRIVAQLPNVRLRTSGDCSEVDVCVNVVHRSFTPDEQAQLSDSVWYGFTTVDAPRVRTIRLNGLIDVPGAAAVRRHIAAHEFGHALGLDHHRRVGVMSLVYRRQLDVLSAEEVALLTQTYGLG